MGAVKVLIVTLLPCSDRREILTRSGEECKDPIGPLAYGPGNSKLRLLERQITLRILKFVSYLKAHSHPVD